MIVRDPGADHTGQDYQAVGEGLYRELVRLEHSITAECGRYGGPRVTGITRIGLSQGDGVVNAGNASYLSGTRLSLLALVVSLRRAGQGNQAVPGLCIYGHWHRSIQHQRFQDVPAQVVIVSLVSARDPYL